MATLGWFCTALLTTLGMAVMTCAAVGFFPDDCGTAAIGLINH